MPISSRKQALTDLLAGELVRVGRRATVITFTSDTTVTLVDHDGHWRGPMPSAFAALVTCPDDAGADSGFWQIFPEQRDQ